MPGRSIVACVAVFAISEGPAAVPFPLGEDERSQRGRAKLDKANQVPTLFVRSSR